MEEKNQPPLTASNGASEASQNRKSLLGILILELISIFVWLIGIFFFYLPLPKSSVALSRLSGEPNGYDALAIIISVIGALFLFYWLRHKRGLAPMVSILFGIVIYNTLSVFIEPLVSLTLVVLLIFWERNYRSFVANNLLVIIGVLAATVSFAGFYKINFLLILLGLVSLYDIAGVFFIKAIPKVAKSAVQQGTPLVLLAPKKLTAWFHPPTPKTTAAILGAGDLFIPLLFLMAVSLQINYQVALVSLFGAVLGNVGNIFLAQKIKSGIPAVPLLAVGLVVGYGIGLIFLSPN